MRIPRLPYLPAEIRDAIESFREDEVIDLISLPIRPKVLPRSKNPSFPPADGSCPLMKLPTEILRQILHEVVILPTKDRVIDPRPPKKEEKTIRNLLVLNKRIYDVLTMILYEERTFGIYVHEGLNGGIEFLDSGIQPLQHKDAFTYLSFPRFDEDSNTGVARVRKVIVTIYPAYDSALLSGISVGHTLNDRRQGEEARHLPLLTYFMLTALSDLLSRHSELGKTRRLTSLTVQFAPPHIEPTAEQNQLTGKWEVTKEAKKRATDAANSILLSHFCADGRTAKATSISGISNMEIILSGFEKLWGVHNARVYLPPGHRDIKALAGLGADVRAAVMRPSADGGKTLAKNLVAARVALEEWVNFAKNGFRFNFEDQMLTEDDWMDGHEQEFDEFGIESDGEDDDFD
ncbi:hypothetical protein MBLNU457_g0173t1 [Dothideomycetes sp. NU457]